MRKRPSRAQVRGQWQEQKRWCILISDCSATQHWSFRSQHQGYPGFRSIKGLVAWARPKGDPQTGHLTVSFPTSFSYFTSIAAQLQNGDFLPECVSALRAVAGCGNAALPLPSLPPSYCSSPPAPQSQSSIPFPQSLIPAIFCFLLSHLRLTFQNFPIYQLFSAIILHDRPLTLLSIQSPRIWQGRKQQRDEPSQKPSTIFDPSAPVQHVEFPFHLKQLGRRKPSK